MTDKAFLQSYWKAADEAEGRFLALLSALHPEDEVQAALDRFGRADGAALLNAQELARLHRHIAQWKKAGILRGEFGLRARNAASRKRIRKDEAFLLTLMAAWTAYYTEVETKAAAMFVAVLREAQADVNGLLRQPLLPSGVTFSDALSVDAAYRARQIQKAAARAKARDAPLSVAEPDFERVFAQQRRWLLAPSTKGETIPNGHHGYIDRIMANLLSYFAIERYRREGVTHVRFVAVIDEVTTENCRRLHGQVFYIDELRPGVNAPPIADPPHDCRSVLRPLKTLQNDAKSAIIYAEDIEIGKDLGAAAFRDAVKLPNGASARLTPGTKITKVYAFAGKGAKKPVRVAGLLAVQYGVSAEEWTHVRGEGFVDVNGTPRRAELHWFEHPEAGRVKMKVKRWFDEG